MYQLQDKWNRDEQMLHFTKASAVCCKQELPNRFNTNDAGRGGGSQNSLQQAVDEGCGRVGDAQCQVWEAERNASNVSSEPCTCCDCVSCMTEQDASIPACLCAFFLRGFINAS